MIGNIRLPGIVWVFILLIAGALVQANWAGEPWAPGVIAAIGVGISALKVYLTPQERDVVDKVEGGLASPQSAEFRSIEAEGKAVAAGPTPGRVSQIFWG